MMFSFRLRTPTAGTLSSLSSTASWAALFWPVQCRCPNRPPRPPGPWLDSFSHISCPMMSTIVLFCSHWNPKYSNCSFVEDSPSLTYGTESSPSWRELGLGCCQSPSSFRWGFRNNDIFIWNTPIVYKTNCFHPSPDLNNNDLHSYQIAVAVVALSNVQVLDHVLAYHNSLADHGKVVGLNPAVSSRQQQVDQGRLTKKKPKLKLTSTVTCHRQEYFVWNEWNYV